MSIHFFTLFLHTQVLLSCMQYVKLDGKTLYALGRNVRAKT